MAKDLLRALDAVAFARAIGIKPDPWQASVLRTSSKRVLLNCSRQAGKSTVAGILGLHRALYRSDSLVLLVSPSQRQSSELFRKVTDHFKALPRPPKLIEDNKLSLRLENGSRIVSLPSSEATIRGFSAANLIIEDEASRVEDDLYRAVRPMLAISQGSLVLMSTPFGKRGHFFEEWTNGGPEWERVRVPAHECARISPAFLESERNALGDWFYRQEYGCDFVETVGAVFRHDLIQQALSSHVIPLFEAKPVSPPPLAPSAVQPLFGGQP